jgi:hypothetical protein
MGVVRLMDLLGDAHEVIRNEAVLLLAGLTRASPDIQKLAAFEGAFDRVLQILECAAALHPFVLFFPSFFFLIIFYYNCQIPECAAAPAMPACCP